MALSGYLLLRQAYNIMGYRSERDKPFNINSPAIASIAAL